MFLAVLLSIGTVAAGAGLAFVPRRGTTWLGALRTFAVVASTTVVFAHLLPEALAEGGLLAALAFAAGAALPAIVEWLLGHRHQHWPGDESHGVGFELGYVALLLHAATDGLAFWACTRPEHAQYDIVLALIAHAVPLTTIVVLHVLTTSGRARALSRAGGLALAAAAGVGAAELVPGEWQAAMEPWLGGAIGGLLLNVVAHGLDTERPITTSGRAVDFFAAVGGLGLAMAGSFFGHGESAHSPVSILGALLDLSLVCAPALLVGLALSALIPVPDTEPNGALGSKRTLAGQVLAGAWLALRLPLAASNAASVASAFRQRGAPPATVLTFAMAVPHLGLETVALTLVLLGGELTVLRLLAGVGGAIAAGIVAARLNRERALRVLPDDTSLKEVLEHAHHHPGHHHATHVHRDHDHALAHPEPQRRAERWLQAFDERVHHTTPWFVLGLTAAGYLSLLVPAGGLANLAANHLDFPLLALLAAPGYVPAPALVPIAFVLITKGVSPGAALLALILGPALSGSMARRLVATCGRPAAVAAALCTLASGVAASGLLEGMAPFEPSPAPHGPLEVGALGLFGLALVRSVWHSGVRSWVAALRTRTS